MVEMVLLEQIINLWEVLLILYLLVNFTYIKRIFNQFLIIFIILCEIYLIIDKEFSSVIVILSIISFMVLNFMAIKVYKYKQDKKGD